jgi:hypothetical protein
MDKPGAQHVVGWFIVILTLVSAVFFLYSFWLVPELTIRVVGRVLLLASLFLQGLGSILREKRGRLSNILTVVAGVMVLLSVATWVIPESN